MATKLALCYHLKKNPLIKKFEDWLIKVKCVDNLICLEQKDFEDHTKATHDTSRCNNNNFSDPPCHGGDVPSISISNPTVAL